MGPDHATFDVSFLPVDGDAGRSRRFVVHHRPARARPEACIVYAHPFAEEMNKSRRMAAMQARDLARSGFEVLQIDLLGCGDSDGDFADATWSRWVDDLVFACRWLQSQHAGAAPAPPPLWLWGLRAGCLLAVEAARRLEQPTQFLFWQPPPSGKVLMQQFLRLKAASELMAGQAKATMDLLRNDIAAGRSVEIAGYTLRAELCRGLEAATLAPPPSPGGRVLWVETSAAENPAPSPAGADVAAAWRQAGWDVRAACVRGAAFWQTTESEDAPALLQATTVAMTRAPQPSQTVTMAHQA